MACATGDSEMVKAARVAAKHLDAILRDMFLLVRLSYERDCRTINVGDLEVMNNIFI